MATRKRTLFHPPFAQLLTERRPRGLAVLSEVELSLGPQRTDVLLIESQEPRDDSTATGFIGFWPLLPRRTLVEFKSRAAPFARGDFSRLVGYGAQYYNKHADELAIHELALALVVTRINAALLRELDAFRVVLSPAMVAGRRQAGYQLGWCGPFKVVLVDLDAVAQAEQDAIAAAFSGCRRRGMQEPAGCCTISSDP